MSFFCLLDTKRDSDISDADKGSGGKGQLLSYPYEVEFSRFFLVNPMGFLTPTTNPIFKIMTTITAKAIRLLL